MNQKGFATLEVILMVMVIGILATVAVPRFTDVTTKANTAKIQSDLATIDSAIDMYYMEKGEYPKDGTLSSTDVSNALKPYIKDISNLKPPSGEAYVDGEAKTIGTNYEVAKVDETTRATLKVGETSKTAGDFYKSKS